MASTHRHPVLRNVGKIAAITAATAAFAHLGGSVFGLYWAVAAAIGSITLAYGFRRAFLWGIAIPGLVFVLFLFGSATSFMIAIPPLLLLACLIARRAITARRPT